MHYKIIKDEDREYCIPCLIEKKVLPLIEDEYQDNKLKILKLLDTIIIRNEKLWPHYRDFYHGENTFSSIKKANEALKQIEEMIFNNREQLDVLIETEKLSLLLGLVHKWDFVTE